MDTQDNGFLYPLKHFENEIVKLVPFKAHHAAVYFEATHPHQELYRYVNIGPFETLSEFSEFIARMQADPTEMCFALIDKRSPPSAIHADGELAGLMTWNDASPDHRTVKISHTIIIPKYFRKSIVTHAVVMLLRYFLASPSEGGLGLLRVEALVSTRNKASIAGFMRGGFRQEGILRWHRVLHNANQRRKTGNGRSMPEYYSDQGDVGRDTVCLSLCWEDWRDGGRETMEKLIEPEVKRPRIRSKL